MRTPRIKIPPATGAAYYHLINRTVNGERLFGDREKEQFRRELWRVAGYCGIDIVTYALMGNHYHIVAQVPQRQPITDAKLVERYCLLHPDPRGAGFSYCAELKQMLALNDETAENWRSRQLAQMGDVSAFMQILQQRFSVWFNYIHDRFGPLWNARFTSVLIQDLSRALRTVTAYVDNNPLRAGLVSDPKEYRFCGYAEAVAGNPQARAGLSLIYPGKSWDEVQAAYRIDLYVAAVKLKTDAASVSSDQLKTVIEQGGRLSLAEALRCRWRYLTRGAVLGSASFVAEHLEAYRTRTGRGLHIVLRPLSGVDEWNGLTAMRWAGQ